MTATRLRRWVCPLCDAGVNAPSRPRRDDVRRFCLPCSAKTGRLVVRTCPAVEHERERRTQAAVARRSTVAERQRDREIARRTVGGVDMLLEAFRMWRLPVIREAASKSNRAGLNEIIIRRSKSKSYSSGHCWPGFGRIVVTAGTDPLNAWEVLLHEVVHAAMPANESHGSLFYSTLRRAAQQAWPDVPFDFMHVRNGRRTDSAIVVALHKAHNK